jgi:hypothetical protein
MVDPGVFTSEIVVVELFPSEFSDNISEGRGVSGTEKGV